MKEFNYFAPGSVEEALELMKEYEGKYTILNGGTDVMIRLRERLINPEAVIDIKRIPGLKEITFSKKDGLYIGACVTCKEISESEIVKENYPFYAQAASVLGSQLVRGRATSVGNVINASPLADTVTPLVACDAKLVVVGPEGQREVSLVSWAGESQEERIARGAFFIFVRKVGLKPGEICGILADDLDAERMTVTVRGIWRESIGEPNFFVAYPEPSVMRLPAWLGGAPRSWAAAAGSELLLEKNGRRRDVEHLRSDTNELLRIVGLEDVKDELATSLPYGKQRRLEIARALATHPKLLMLDEPAAGMNPQETNELTEFIGRIRDEFHMTILLIEHHMDLVMDISDRIYVIDFGELIATGTPEEIQNNQRVIDAYLGVEEDA